MQCPFKEKNTLKYDRNKKLVPCHPVKQHKTAFNDAPGY